MTQILIIVFLGIVGPIVFFRLGIKTTLHAFMYQQTKNVDPTGKYPPKTLFEAVYDALGVYQRTKDERIKIEIEKTLRDVSIKMVTYSSVINEILEGRKLQ